jgi:hypothetical protein
MADDTDDAGPTREECTTKFSEMQWRMAKPGEKLDPVIPPEVVDAQIRELAAAVTARLKAGIARNRAVSQAPAAHTLHDESPTPEERANRGNIPRSLRPRWLYPLNFGLLQWFGVRLQRSLSYRDGAWHHDRWNLRRWVLPLTGWWSRYIETRGAR